MKPKANKIRLLIFIFYLFVNQMDVCGIGQTITFDSIPDKTCQDLSFAITATSTSNLPVTFRILYGSVILNGNIITINGPGTVVIEASQYGNATYDTAITQTRSFNVAFPYNPSTAQIAVFPMLSLCEGQILTHYANSVDGIDFKWTKPDGSSQISNNLVIQNASLSDSGNYSVTLFNGQCTFKKIDFLTQVHKRPSESQFVMKDSVFVADDPILLTATPSGGNFIGNHVVDQYYYPNLANSIHDTITYTYSNTYGCKNSKTIAFELFRKKLPKIDSSSTITIYEFISDNGDGKNDFWQIDNLNKYKQYEIFVVDTWGNKVFTTNNYQNNWSGQGLPSGSYFYSVNILDTKTEYTGGLFITH